MNPTVSTAIVLSIASIGAVDNRDYDCPLHGTSSSQDAEGSTIRESTASSIEFSAIDTPRKWGKKLNSRFLQLVDRKIDQQINEAELDELQKLQSIRENLVCPKNPDDIQREIRQSKLVRDLITSIEKYVEFHESSSEARQAK